MTILQKIQNLTWWTMDIKLKDILSNLLNRVETIEESGSGGNTSTLQQVTEAGATTTVPTTFTTTIVESLAVSGIADNGVGVYGSGGVYGVQGESPSDGGYFIGNRGVYATGSTVGVIATSVNGIGIQAISSNGIGGEIRIDLVSTSNILNLIKGGNIVASIEHDGKVSGNSFVATNGTIRLKNYTVVTLPVGVQGDTAFVTDATAPTYLGVLTGGGSVACPVFHDGVSWKAH